MPLILRKEKITGWKLQELWHQMGLMLKTVFEKLWFFIILSVLLDWIVLWLLFFGTQYLTIICIYLVWAIFKVKQDVQGWGLCNDLEPLTIAAKNSALEVWLGSEYELYRKGLLEEWGCGVLREIIYVSFGICSK